MSLKFGQATHYVGVRFASRLEARWAAWMDAHAIVWDYEPEAYRVGGLSYAPDFYLPELRAFLEVKGILEALDLIKLRALAELAAPLGLAVLLAEAPHGWTFRPVNPQAEVLDPAAVELCRCGQCRRWHFVATAGQPRCPVCEVAGPAAIAGGVHPHQGGRWPSEPCPLCVRLPAIGRVESGFGRPPLPGCAK